MVSIESTVKTMLAEKIIHADLERYVNGQLKDEDLTFDVDSVFVLYALQKYKEFKQKEISEMLDIDPATMGRMIGRLEKGSLVEKTKNANDGRRNQIRITQKGDDMLSMLNTIINKWFDEIVKPFAKEQKSDISVEKRIRELAKYIIKERWGDINNG